MQLKKGLLSAGGASTLAITVGGQVWRWIGNAGDLDFVVSHIRDLGWAGDIIAFLLNPPPWSVIPILLIGLTNIWYDLNRRKNVSAKHGIGQPGHGPSWRQRMRGPELLMGIGFAVFAAGVLWYLVRQSNRKEAGKGPDQALDIMLSMECDVAHPPIILPASGKISRIEIQTGGMPTGSTINGVGKITSHPGTNVTWPSRSPIYKCTVVNISQFFLTNITVFIDLQIWEGTFPAPNGSYSVDAGKETFKGQWVVPISYLEKGEQNAFVFYVFNNTYPVSAAKLSNKATANVGDRGKMDIGVAVVEPNMLWIDIVSLNADR